MYFELLRRGYKVSVGKYGNTEIDFVAERNGELEYIQVTADMTATIFFYQHLPLFLPMLCSPFKFGISIVPKKGKSFCDIIT